MLGLPQQTVRKLTYFLMERPVTIMSNNCNRADKAIEVAGHSGWLATLANGFSLDAKRLTGLAMCLALSANLLAGLAALLEYVAK